MSVSYVDRSVITSKSHQGYHRVSALPLTTSPSITYTRGGGGAGDLRRAHLVYQSDSYESFKQHVHDSFQKKTFTVKDNHVAYSAQITQGVSLMNE